MCTVICYRRGMWVLYCASTGVEIATSLYWCELRDKKRELQRRAR